MAFFNTLKERFKLLKLWLILGGTLAVGNYKIETLPNVQKAKDEALKQALKALEEIGSKQYRGCARKVRARAAHAFITTQLAKQGVVI
jgi:hypothetical protein